MQLFGNIFAGTEFDLDSTVVRTSERKTKAPTIELPPHAMTVIEFTGSKVEGLLWFVETSTYKIYLSMVLSVITSWNVKAFDIWCGAPPHDLKLEY